MLNVFKKLKWFFSLYWKQYSLAISLLIIASVIEIVPLWLVGEAIDDMTSGAMRRQLVWYYVGAVLLAMILSYVMNFIWQYQLFGGAISLERILRKRLMQQFLKMTPTFYEKNRTGDLMARATNDLNAVSLTAGFGIMTLIDSTVFMALIIIAWIKKIFTLRVEELKHIP